MAAVGAFGTHTKVTLEDAGIMKVRTLTNQSLAKADAHAKLSPAEKATTLEALKKILTDRQVAIREAAHTKPHELAGMLFDEVAIRSFPEEVQSLLEKPFKKTGTYKIALVTTNEPDHLKEGALTPHEEGYEEYFIKIGEGEQYRLFLTPTEAYRFSPDTSIEVTGVDIGNAHVIPTIPLTEHTVNGGTVRGASTVKKVAIIAFNFQNNTTELVTPTQIQERVFTNADSVHTYYKEVSYGQWDIQGKNAPTGDVYGWITIPANADGTCNYNRWATLAKNALIASGVSLTGYTNIQYVFPVTNSGCAWAGLAYLGSPTSDLMESWVGAEYLTTRVSGHELGHNFGFHHAANYNCVVATNSSPSTCVSSEYGDPYDIMGNSTKHTNNFNKSKYWFNTAQMQTVTDTGTFTIEPTEVNSAGVKLLRIKRPFTSSLGTFTNGYYQIEMRTATGTYGNFAATDPATKGILVRLVNDYTLGGAIKTFYVRTILLGEELVDTEAGITISLTSIASSSAQVHITKVAPVCVRNNPTVTVSPKGSWVVAGTAVPYSVTIINNDSASCAPASFAITTALPTGFTQTPASLTLTANPQTSASGTVSILSPLSTALGTYPIVVTATHSASSTSVQTTANYNVLATDTIAPVVTITQPLNGSKLTKGKTTTVTVNATDASGIATLDIIIDGKSVKTCSLTTTCAYSWNTLKISAGTHTIEGRATDNSSARNSGSAQVIVTK
jgi:hypothetical protein